MTLFFIYLCTELNYLSNDIIGERAKRARRYLVMFMETRDIYIYIYVRLFLIRMRALVFCELIKS